MVPLRKAYPAPGPCRGRGTGRPPRGSCAPGPPPRVPLGLEEEPLLSHCISQPCPPLSFSQASWVALCAGGDPVLTQCCLWRLRYCPVTASLSLGEVRLGWSRGGRHQARWARWAWTALSENRGGLRASWGWPEADGCLSPSFYTVVWLCSEGTLSATHQSRQRPEGGRDPRSQRAWPGVLRGCSGDSRPRAGHTHFSGEPERVGPEHDGCCPGEAWGMVQVRSTWL